MKHNNDRNGPAFIPYDDECMEHATAGPDYGQPWSASNAWTELDSKEYPTFVSTLRDKILSQKISIVPKP